MSKDPIVPTGSKWLEDSAHVFALQAMVHGKVDEQAFGQIYQGGLSASAQFFAKTYALAVVNTALQPALVNRFTPDELGARFAQAIAPLDPVMVAFATSQLQEKKGSALFPELASAITGFKAIRQAQAGSVPNPEHLGVSFTNIELAGLAQSESPAEWLGLPTASVAPATATPANGEVTVNLLLVKRALEKEGYTAGSLVKLKGSEEDIQPLQPLLDEFKTQRQKGLAALSIAKNETTLEVSSITLSQVEKGLSGTLPPRSLDAVLATLALAAWRKSRTPESSAAASPPSPRSPG